MKSPNRVVRYHRWLRDIALPQESASTNAFSTATQPDRATAGRWVLAAWLPFIFVTRAVMCATKDERHQSEPGGKHLPGNLPHAIPAQMRCLSRAGVNRARCLRRDSVPAPVLSWNRRFMVRFPDCQSRFF
jgi:hypothetical protein